MNKKIILTAAALALGLCWTACNKSGKLAEPSTFKTPAGPVELKLKWPVGERIVQDMDMKQNMEISMPGQSAPMKQEMTMGQEYGLTVLKADPDGGHELEMEFRRAQMGMSMGGKTLMSFDSAKKSTATDKPDPAGDMFGKIVGAKILYFLDATNEVARLEGIDALENRLSSGASPTLMASIKSMFSDSYFKQLMSQNRFLPTKPVQPGDTWPVQISLPMATLGVLVMNYNFTFQSWEMHGKRNCARLDFQGTMKGDADPKPNAMGMTISDLDGTTSGTSWFDPELGTTIDTSMNQDIGMVIHMAMPSGRNQDASAPTQGMTNQMHQVMNLKLVSVK
jgi:hypothetical protein